jgi:putative flippase GtrA
LLFWAESAVIGFYNLCKLGKLGGWSVLFYGPFFVGHYGAFMVGHLLFIYGFFGDGFGSGTDVQVTQVLQDFLQLAPVLLAFFISHGISFFTNFLGRQEYRGKDIKQQMSQPYRRIIIMHVTIIFGGFMAMAFDTVLPALLLLIVLKLVMDLHAHLAEHGKLT